MFVGEFLNQLRIRIVAKQVLGRPAMGIRCFESYNRVTQDDKIGPAAGTIDRVRRSGIPVIEVGCGGRGKMPTAEKPIIPIRSGETSNSMARLRTSRIALCASPSSIGW
jgi:hypothetical protein